MLAVEEGPFGVRSNVIAPGAVGNTEGMGRLSLLTKKDENGDSTIAYPLGRIGDSRDIANATVFLFSDAARYISAQTIVVDGAQDNGASIVPYPSAVLDPAKYLDILRPKL